MNIFHYISSFYWNYIASPIQYSKHIGVQIGDNCLIATKNWSSEPYLIKVGNHVQITNEVYIHTHGGANCIRKENPEFDVFGKVIIEDWAYIGAYSQIMPGVTIGEGALVAAGSVVTKSVPPHCVVGGNPAKYICTTQEYIQNNDKYNLKCKGLERREKRQFLLSQTEEKFIQKNYMKIER